MTLDEVIRDVVYNNDIQALLKKPDLKLPYGEITQFQIDECEENDTSIEDEGFQIGEPFDGDIAAIHAFLFRQCAFLRDIFPTDDGRRLHRIRNKLSGERKCLL